MGLPLIVVCGLPQTGKTETARAIKKGLLPEIFEMYGAGETNTRKGKPISNERHKDIAQALNNGTGVIIHASYKTSRRRQELYDLASSLDAYVVLIETACSEKLSKARLSSLMASREYRASHTSAKL